MQRLLCVLLSLMVGLLPSWSWACEARSGNRTTALIELYTAEGCSSCVPAETRLGQLPANSILAIPLALHVPYWDYTGWKDRFAQPGFVQRQQWLVRANGGNGVFTPHIFVSGSELLFWRNELTAAVHQINSLPARADLAMHGFGLRPNVMALDVRATTAAPYANDAALYLVLTEGGLSSQVTAGDNDGLLLHEDHVVRLWLGPLPLNGQAIDVQKGVSVPTGWNKAQMHLVAFVQSQRTGEVLQALSMPVCFGDSH